MAESDVYGFRRLAAWQKSQTSATQICRIVDELPRKRSADILGAQLIRSAASVPANIAEGYGRFSKGAYRNHLSIARGSLAGTESNIDLLRLAGHLTEARATELTAKCHEIARLLTTYMKSVGTRVLRDDEDAAYEA
jgi:four helix bundle protein